MIKRSHSDRPQRPGPEGCVLRGHSARTRSTSARSQPQPPPAPPAHSPSRQNRRANHARSRMWDAALYTHLSAPGARTHLSAQFARNTARTAQGAHTFSRHRATHSLVLAASLASRSHARRTSCHPERAAPVNDHPNPHAARHIITPLPVSSSISGGGTVVPYRLHRR